MSKKKKIFLLIVSIVCLLFGIFIAFLFYMNYSTVYFGYEGDQFVESIGGPYMIPLILMIVLAILFIVAFILLIREMLRLDKQ